MSGFLANIINRHINGSNSVKPRARSIFEPNLNTPDTLQSDETGQNFAEGLDTYATPTQTVQSIEPHQGEQKVKHLFKSEKDSERQRPPSSLESTIEGQNLPGDSHTAKNHPDQPNELSGETFRYSSKSSLHEGASIKTERGQLFELLNTSREYSEKQHDRLVIKNVEKSVNLSSEQNKAINANILNGVSLKQQRKNSFSDGLATENAPRIKIHIGRVEIKATHQTREKIINRQTPQKLMLPLEEFLKQRDNK